MRTFAADLVYSSEFFKIFLRVSIVWSYNQEVCTHSLKAGPFGVFLEPGSRIKNLNLLIQFLQPDHFLGRYIISTLIYII